MNLQEQIEKLEKELAYLKSIVCTPATLGVVKPWEPDGGYWFVNGNGDVSMGGSIFRYREFGIERPTKELAERASTMMRKFNRLLAYHDEFCPEHDPTGACDGVEDVFSVICDEGDWTTVISCASDCLSVYFPQDVAEELCRKLNSGEVVL